jgi:hypothetical protein
MRANLFARRGDEIRVGGARNDEAVGDEILQRKTRQLLAGRVATHDGVRRRLRHGVGEGLAVGVELFALHAFEQFTVQLRRRTRRILACVRNNTRTQQMQRSDDERRAAMTSDEVLHACHVVWMPMQK